MGIKRKIRKMRSSARKNPDGSYSSHLMAWVGDTNKKRGDFGVYPTIYPKKKGSSNPKDWGTQTPVEAAMRGEMIHVKRRKRAEKLAAGSWKRGKERREAMKAYRKRKKK